MSEEYLMYRTEQLMLLWTAQMQLHLCTLGLNSIAQMERSPFHPDALIKTRGHIIQEMECQPVQVISALGYQRGDLCHMDYLPVYLGEEAVYLDVMGMIVTTPVLDQLDFKGIFTPIFQATNERLIQVNPQVTEVKMVISNPEGLGFHESPLDHMEETDSLLYTKSESKPIMSIYMPAEPGKQSKLQ